MAGADIELGTLMPELARVNPASDEGGIPVGEVGEVIAPLVATDLLPAQRGDTGSGREAVLAALAAGAERPGQIAETTGYSDRHVRNILGELTKTGAVEQTGYGRYTPAG